jgi:hypothetical protein
MTLLNHINALVCLKFQIYAKNCNICAETTLFHHINALIYLKSQIYAQNCNICAETTLLHHRNALVCLKSQIYAQNCNICAEATLLHHRNALICLQLLLLGLKLTSRNATEAAQPARTSKASQRSTASRAVSIGRIEWHLTFQSKASQQEKNQVRRQAASPRAGQRFINW